MEYPAKVLPRNAGIGHRAAIAAGSPVTRGDENAQGRALLLFERLADRPEDRARLTAGEDSAVLTILTRLEAAAPRARRLFPTEEDRSAGRRAPLALPKSVGNYWLEALLGEGGMGLVFAARRCDGLFEHEVAVKLIHPDRFDATAIDRFNAERRMLARLDHPGIARLIDGGVTDDGWPYIIMERVAGDGIDTHCERHRLATDARVDLLIAVAGAVQAAQSALVIHGDIKPDNVMVGADGLPRLLDFGIARLADGEAPIGLQPRTAAFAAPARVAGAAPTIAADVYALGMLLRHLIPARSRDLAAIADRATAAMPAARYGTAGEMALDLTRWREGRPVEARPATLGYVLARLVARHRLAAAVAAASLAALLAVLAVALIGWNQARARVDDLRRLADYQLVELDQRLDALPHSLTLRAQLAREAQGYLERLVAQPESPPDLRLQAADGFRRLALLQGASDRPSLGDTAAARLSFARARGVLPPGNDPATRRLRDEIVIDEARMIAAASHPEAAARLLATVDRAGMAPRTAARYLLARSEIGQWNGQYAAAIADARRAQDLLAGATPDRETARLRLAALDLEAEAAFYAGDRATAKAVYARGLAAAIDAARRSPGDRAIRWALNKARWALGTTLIDLGQADAAVPLLRAAFTSAEAEARDDPADHVLQHRYRSNMLAYGQALSGAGQRADGLALMRRSQALREAYWRRAPDDASRRRDWMIATAALGDSLAEGGETAAACRAYAAAGEALARIARAGTLTALDRHYAAGALRTARARHCGTAGGGAQPPRAARSGKGCGDAVGRARAAGREHLFDQVVQPRHPGRPADVLGKLARVQRPGREHVGILGLVHRGKTPMHHLDAAPPQHEGEHRVVHDERQWIEPDVRQDQRMGGLGVGGIQHSVDDRRLDVGQRQQAGGIAEGIDPALKPGRLGGLVEDAPRTGEVHARAVGREAGLRAERQRAPHPVAAPCRAERGDQERAEPALAGADEDDAGESFGEAFDGAEKLRGPGQIVELVDIRDRECIVPEAPARESRQLVRRQHDDQIPRTFERRIGDPEVPRQFRELRRNSLDIRQSDCFHLHVNLSPPADHRSPAANNDLKFVSEWLQSTDES